jgi:ribonuclease HI
MPLGGTFAKGLLYFFTSSMTMEVMAVTKALSWLETQAFTNACVLGDCEYA